MGVRAVVKAAVGERAAEPFVKEQEEQGDLNVVRHASGTPPDIAMKSLI
jgi:hypothetical protein